MLPNTSEDNLSLTATKHAGIRFTYTGELEG